MKRILFVLVIFTVFCAMSSFAEDKAEYEKEKMPPAKLEKQKLVKALQDGGYIIYFRHHITDDKKVDEDRTNLKDCSTQRNLTAEGKKGSIEIGRAFRKLKIKVSSVISSPYCRCRDTAVLAFGATELDDDLQFAIYDGPEERRRKGQALRKLLSQKPKEKTNSVIVSHTANLKEAANIWPKPEGVAIIFEPNGNGQFEFVGIVLPDEWKKYLKPK
ncbi:MAG: hypothetical protein HYW47_00550 [Deltaproteobacteria bacterium]|nr:hypothetical protein [Deltaproteobacteria bacterium]